MAAGDPKEARGAARPVQQRAATPDQIRLTALAASAAGAAGDAYFYMGE